MTRSDIQPTSGSTIGTTGPTRMTTPTGMTRPTGIAVLLVVGGAIGLWAAFKLTIEKFIVLEDPSAQLSCNYSILVGCSKNLASWQGELFGFPNSLLGIAGWAVVITIGASLLAGAHYTRWFWIALNIGMAAAMSLIVFFMYTSFYVLDVLCPRCMVTWFVTVPVFLGVTFYNLKVGNWSAKARVRRFGGLLLTWVPLVTLAVYLLAAVLAQLEMDFLHRL
jgi:uncharacterized membrane protein